MRRVLIACALVVGAAQGGCTQGELTELLVVVDTELAVPSELTRVAFEVTGPRGDVQRASADFAAGEARPAILALVHRDGPLGPLTIQIDGERGNERVVTRTARVHFVPGRVLTLRVLLTQGCVGVRCETGETCGERGCRGVDVAVEELEPWKDGGAPAPDAATYCGERASCEDGLACTRDVCRAGECVHEPDASACDDGVACTIERCDPDSGCESEVSHASCALGEFCDRDDGCRPAPSFGEVYAFFLERCVHCHAGDRPDGDLDLASPMVAWTNLVDTASTCDSSTRVVPRDARASLLWRKVARVDLCRSRMPPSGPPTSGSDQRMIERWINGGASND